MSNSFGSQGTVQVFTEDSSSGTTVSVKSISGAALVYGLARNMVRVSSGAYNTTEILGWRVLVPGTGTLVLSPVGGATDITLTSAEVIAMGYQTFFEHLDSITLGNADMEILVYTP